jgi:hypothetical protein
MGKLLVRLQRRLITPVAWDICRTLTSFSKSHQSALIGKGRGMPIICRYLPANDRLEILCVLRASVVNLL